MHKMTRHTAGFIFLFLGLISSLQGGDYKKFGIEIEGGPVWQSRSDVRIPNNTGTLFSLQEIQGSGPFAAGRIYFDYRFKPRHEFVALAAPLSLTASGPLSAPISFAGETFMPGQDVDATFQFNSYRFTYRYRFHEGKHWTWKIGATGKIRDAKIELRQGGVSALDENLGVVPLVHLDGEYRWSGKWRFHFNMDGLAAPQGRAFDIALKLKYDISDNWTLGTGYRMLEGGADTDEIYTFAWLHYATVSVTFRF